jgi:hypothetical protein
MYSSTLPSTSALDGGWVGGQRHAPAALPLRKTRPLGGPQGPVWTGVENVAPSTPGFDRRTVQPVA